MSTIGGRIQTVRKERKKEAKALYTKLGISKQAWSNYEKDRRTPELYKLIDISNELCVSLDYLTCRTNIQFNPKDEDFEALMEIFPGLEPEHRKQLIDTAKKLRRTTL